MRFTSNAFVLGSMVLSLGLVGLNPSVFADESKPGKHCKRCKEKKCEHGKKKEDCKKCKECEEKDAKNDAPTEEKAEKKAE